jgi:uracil-DNA glycosylase family 4
MLKPIMVVGIAPTKQDLLQGKAFTGLAGRMLNCILASVGVNSSDIYYTNLLDKPYDKDPDPEQVLARLPYLLSEIKHVSPRLVVSLGTLPSEMLLQQPLKKVRGNPLFRNGRYYLATYNIAAVLRGGYTLVNTIVRDLAKIPVILNMPHDGPQLEPDWHLVTSLDEFHQLLNSLPPAPEPIVIDIETTNPAEEIDTFVDRLLCVGFAFKGKSYVVPSEFCDGQGWPLDKRYVFHNGIFDSQGLLRYLGIKLPICEDTMLISYSLDERAGFHKLKSLSREYIGADYYEQLKGGYEQGTELYEYNAKDVDYTLRLFNILKPMQVRDKTTWFYDNILIPASNAFVDIQHRGTFVSLPIMRELGRDWLPKVHTLQQGLIADASKYGFPGDINLNSPKQLSHLLYDLIGLRGGPSTARPILELLDHPYIQQLLEWRQYDHMIRSYLIGIRDDLKRDNRVHAHVLLHGTVTGRLSYKDPPLQTIPKEGKVGPDLARIRNIFTATNDEYCIVEADYEKAEVWGAASVSGDAQLLTDLQSFDFHKNVAAAVFRKPYDEVTKDERQAAKAVTFGVMYGRSGKSLSEHELNWATVREANDFIEAWFARYPDYTRWYNATKDLIKKQGELVSPLGRKRRFIFVPPENYEVLNQGVNFPIQSLASDITLSSAIELHYAARALDSYVLWLVHDSIVCEVSRKYLREFIQLMESIMTKSRFDGIYGVPIEIKVGDSLGSTREYIS